VEIIELEPVDAYCNLRIKRIADNPSVQQDPIRMPLSRSVRIIVADGPAIKGDMHV